MGISIGFLRWVYSLSYMYVLIARLGTGEDNL